MSSALASALYQKRKLLGVLLAFAVTVFVFISYKEEVTEPHSQLLNHTYQMQPASSDGRKQTCQTVFRRTFARTASTYRQCLLSKIKKDAWDEIVPAIEKCLGDTLYQMMDAHLFLNGDDAKMAILPKKDEKGNWPQMIEVTLGVGNNIEAEKQLRQLLPNCKFFGADPTYATGAIFQQMGQYNELAVSGKAGSFKSSILENGRYCTKTVKTIGFSDFLLRYTKTPRVDYFFLDTEGGEYELITHMLKNGDVENNGIVICQMSAEMHGILAHSTQLGNLGVKFHNLTMAMLNKSSFLPVWITFVMGQLRTFYINVDEPYCIDTFFTDKFCY